MRANFDNKLSELNKKLLSMAAMTEQIIAMSIKSLEEQNTKLARETVEFDAKINEAEREVERICLNLLLQQQPVFAEDLRRVSAALKMITDIERVGDQSADIADLNIQLIKKKQTWDLTDISEMARAATQMVNEVLPQDVIEELDRLTDGKAIISTEVGQHQMWAAQYYNFKCPRSFASSGGLGTMGYGFGAGMGAKVGNPDRTVVNIAGDGSFFMNCNELSSLAKHKIPLVELVFENDVLGMVRQWQRLFYGKRFSQTNIERGTDLMKLADAFGVEGIRITKKSEIKPMLEKALKCGKPFLVDVIINKDINVLPMVPAGADVSQPIMNIELD